MFDDQRFKRIWDVARPFTMTSPERGYALYSAVQYLVTNKIHGAFVECGVWRGGSAMIMLLALKELGIRGRDVILFDTFEGMTEPGGNDLDCYGRSASGLMSGQAGTEQERVLVHAAASEEEVRSNLALCGYSPRRIRLVKGDVRKTLRCTQTGPIALLRLDTDFYDSTLAELDELYPRVQQEGVVLIDDYGHWQGSRAAVDDYFIHHAADLKQPLLHAVDYTGRIMVKQDPATRVDIDRYDYIPPGLDDPSLLRYFGSLEMGDPTKVKWPHLRYRVPHIWRRDSRSPAQTQIGVMSCEEALLIFNLAKQFAGRRALEIGCHFGWTSAHLLSAGVRLDIIDPALGEPGRVEALRSSLESVPNRGAYHLWAGFSPSIVPAVRAAQEGPWSVIVIDGNHEGDAPMQDALAVSEHCAADAMVIFHDLVSPHVAEGLRALKQRGWKTRIYNTMQIIGVAWRGEVSCIDHVEDPNIPYPFFYSSLRDLKNQ